MNSQDYLGVVRDGSKAFFSWKSGSKFQQDRFKPKRTNFKNFHDKNSDESENPSDGLLGEDKLGNGSFTKKPMNNIREEHVLPPRWVDQEEEIEEDLDQIELKRAELEGEVNKIRRHDYFNAKDIPLYKIENITEEIIVLIRK